MYEKVLPNKAFMYRVVVLSKSYSATPFFTFLNPRQTLMDVRTHINDSLHSIKLFHELQSHLWGGKSDSYREQLVWTILSRSVRNVQCLQNRICSNQSIPAACHHSDVIFVLYGFTVHFVRTFVLDRALR